MRQNFPRHWVQVFSRTRQLSRVNFSTHGHLLNVVLKAVNDRKKSPGPFASVHTQRRVRLAYLSISGSCHTCCQLRFRRVSPLGRTGYKFTISATCSDFYKALLRGASETPTPRLWTGLGEIAHLHVKPCPSGGLSSVAAGVTSLPSLYDVKDRLCVRRRITPGKLVGGSSRKIVLYCTSGLHHFDTGLAHFATINVFLSISKY